MVRATCNLTYRRQLALRLHNRCVPLSLAFMWALGIELRPSCVCRRLGRELGQKIASSSKTSPWSKGAEHTAWASGCWCHCRDCTPDSFSPECMPEVSKLHPTRCTPDATCSHRWCFIGQSHRNLLILPDTFCTIATKLSSCNRNCVARKT